LETTWSALVVDDDPGIRQSLRLCLEPDGARVLGVASGAATLEALERARYDVLFLDLWLGNESGLTLLPEVLRRQPGIPVIVITAHASFETAVEAMKLGAFDYLPKPFAPAQVRHAARRAISEELLKREITELKERVGESDGETVFESASPLYRAFLQNAARAAASDVVVLLTGESGTGKGVLARWIRDQSKRAERPFVTVHCPMLTSDLMASALFGHKKGAFTGAVADAPGKVEEAEGGTLFLDEVGDLTPDAQARLLRFLNDRTYERVGDAKERTADVRIVTATNRSLEAEVASGRFREDLVFRLSVVSLRVPALRDRREDVLPLAHHFLRVFGARQGRPSLGLSAAAESAIASYGWPGNLRQLRNAVERAVILAPAPTIEASDLGLPGAAPDDVGPAVRPRPGLVLGEDATVEEVEREHMARVVARAPSLDAAAKILGIDVRTLQRKRKRYGLS
jgi:NtrC-family two-component system response regulator AlgB